MDQHIQGVAGFGAALTDEEMDGVVGGDGEFARMVGYAVGFLAGWPARIIVLGATNPDLQAYEFGA